MVSQPTAFASADRSGAEEIKRQARLIEGDSAALALLEQIPLPTMVLNHHRQVVAINLPALEVLGARHREDIHGQRPGEAFHCQHADKACGGCGTLPFCRYCGAVGAILKAQAGTPACEECHITVDHGDRQEALDLRVWARPIIIGGESYTLFIIIDIAAEKRRAFLERMFLHDLTNTVSALSGFVTLLEYRQDDAAARRQLVSRIATLGERAIDEINGHRQLIAAEKGELVVEPKPLRSLDVLRRALTAYHEEETLAGRSLILVEGSADVAFTSDSAILDRVIGNMVKNAMEASTSGDTVSLGCRQEDNEVCFFVHNSAHMPEHVQMQLFQRSFSTKGVGRGLGTYSMKYLTERYLAGRLWFSSTAAAGTTFFAAYPLAFPAKSA